MSDNKTGQTVSVGSQKCMFIRFDIQGWGLLSVEGVRKVDDEKDEGNNVEWNSFSCLLHQLIVQVADWSLKLCSMKFNFKIVYKKALRIYFR